VLDSPGSQIAKTLIFTILALTAFAANSVLCRSALGDSAIDAASFTLIRLLSGAATLAALLKFGRRKNSVISKGSWFAGIMLFGYAVCFSFAYTSLTTGTGALILFAAVQITMIVASLIAGHRLHTSEWLGVAIAFGGFVYLVLPGISAPSLTGFALMTAAGIAWGIYTIKGRGSGNPLMDTTYNFLRTLPGVCLLAIVSLAYVHYSPKGIVLAIISGALASGIGYTIWYIALGGLSAVQAAVVQLSVPVIAALGGVIFISEPITARLAFSTLLIIGGIMLVVLGRHYLARSGSDSKRQEG